MLLSRLRLALCGLLVLAGCAGGSPTTSETESTEGPAEPVVAVVGDSAIALSEFETAYRDANSASSPSGDSLSAYREFLDQYVNYRLKVRAARAAGLDTLPSVRREVRSYRQKMAEPRLMRSNVYEPLTRTLYERQQEEVEVSHILVQVSPDAAPKDTLAAYRKMQSIADSLKRGVPFDALAYRNSEDPSAQRKGQRGFRGRLGYIQAGQIVEPFEKRMYSVPPDSTSDIFRTRFGYHILKVHDRRSARPWVRLSHIMTRPEGDSAAARRLLDSLRTELTQRGASFDSLARQYSDDRRSASNGGDLGQIDSRQSLPPAFRRAVARLDSVGAVSGLVDSQYGYHLIKLTDREEPKSYEASYEDLKQQITDRPRVDRQKNAYADSVRANEGVTVDTARILEGASVSSIDTLSRPLLSLVEEDTAAVDTPVATLGDSSYTLRQLARHVMQTDGGAQMSVGEVLDDFLDQRAFRYAQARLETTDPDFAATMKEYREGLLVFRFMQDSVWNAAARDTASLRAFYRERKDQYRFPDRVRTIVLRAPTDSLLTPYVPSDSAAQPFSVVEAAASDSLVRVDTTMVTDSSTTVYRQVLSQPDGRITGPLRRDGNALLLVRDTLLAARPKTFEEALSSVTRDYQNRYEDNVLSRLRRRYEVETYPERLRRAFADDDSSPPTN